ncbi:hypothetical protein ACIA8K_30105 [Catenuloplanes sp. NPDC051500]|uniref:hypothetical protein n=1 Tax=Catenuloplanes sp. NPDC051500 TaxID=3363959 RepID=UPI0037BC4A7F
MRPLRTLTVLCAVSVLVLQATPAIAAGTVRPVSVATDGTRGDDRTFADIDVDGSGRYIAFRSRSGNLSPAAPAGGLFVRDLDAGTTTLVATGAHHPSFDLTGRYLAYLTADALTPADTDELEDAYLVDLQTGVTTLASADVPGDVWQVRLAADATHVGLIAEGAAYLRDLTAGTTTLIDGAAYQIDLSADGRYVVFSTATPGLVPDDVPTTPGNGIGPDVDIFVRDLQAGTLDQVTVTYAGGQTSHSDTTVSISADGNRVVFASNENDIVPGDTNTGRRSRDIFLRDRAAGVTTKVSLNDAGEQVGCVCNEASISADGRYVTFRGVSGELTPDDTEAWADIFVRDLPTGTNTLASPSAGDSDGHSQAPAVSAHGETVAFVSADTALAPPDVNNSDDAFAWRP